MFKGLLYIFPGQRTLFKKENPLVIFFKENETQFWTFNILSSARKFIAFKRKIIVPSNFTENNSPLQKSTFCLFYYTGPTRLDCTVCFEDLDKLNLIKPEYGLVLGSSKFSMLLAPPALTRGQFHQRSTGNFGASKFTPILLSNINEHRP